MFNVASLTALPDRRFDDVAIAARSVEATLLAATSPRLTVFIDTLVDVHRGYTPRSALYDGRYNPRLAGKVVANLQAILRAGAGAASVRYNHGDEVLACELGIEKDQRARLIVPCAEVAREAFLGRMGETSSQAKRVRLSTLTECGVGEEILLEPYLLVD